MNSVIDIFRDGIFLLVLLLSGCALPESELSDTSYPEKVTQACAPGARGRSNRQNG